MKKVIALGLLLSLLLTGCSGSDKNEPEQKPAPQKMEQRNTVQTKEPSKHDTKRGSVDSSIPVSKEEMDKFIDIAKTYQLIEADIKRLVQILKQCNVKIENEGMEIAPIKETHFGGMGHMTDEIVGYKIFTQDLDKLNDTLHQLGNGYVHLMYGKEKTSDTPDFVLKYHFFFGENNTGEYSLYRNHRIWGTMDDLVISDAAYKKIYDTIVQEAEKYGKFIEIKTTEKWKGKAITCIGMDAIKWHSHVIYIREPGIRISIPVTIESKVYGEGIKQIKGVFEFRMNGDRIVSHFE